MTLLVAVIGDAQPAAAGGTVTGGGTFQILPTTSNMITVAFQCVAQANGDATQTRILPSGGVPSMSDGCVLRQATIPVASAPGRSLPGPVVATAATASLTLPLGTLDVCWKAEATFSDGGETAASGCQPLPLPPVGPGPLPAAPAATLIFTGTASVAPALSYRTGPTMSGTWSLSGGGGGRDSTGAPGVGSISASGDLSSASCDRSAGSSGVGSFNVGGESHSFSALSWPTTDGFTYRFTGTSSLGRVEGIMTWIPPQPGFIGAGSCASGTATLFTIVGLISYFPA